jgi:hypothetical protein
LSPELDAIIALALKGGAAVLLVYFSVRAFNFGEKFFERAVVALEAIKQSVENMDEKLDRALEKK